MIRVKLDEDLPADIVQVLPQDLFDVATVYSQNFTGYPDNQLFPEVQKESRWIFTADKGFGDIRKFPPSSHHGIVLFRADRESRSNYVKLTQLLISRIDLHNYVGSLIVVTFRGIRIIQPPSTDS